MRKKIFTFLLALVAGAGTIYASDTQVDDIWYDFDGGNLTAEVTYRGDDPASHSDRYSGVVVIPSSVIYNAQTYTVTSIGISAFEGCSGLTSVTIPNSVTSIGNYAFFGCSSLTSVTIPNTVTSIGIRAFSGCSSLPVVDNLRYADNTYLVEAVNKSLSSYTIKDGTKWIGDDAFEECYNLTSVTILNSVTRIGDYAFYDCTGLISVEIPNSVTSIGENAFAGCSGLTSVTIPSSVTRIEEGTFAACSGLTSVTIPNTVTSIGTGAFSSCSSLTSVTNYATTPQTIYSSVFDGVDKSTCVLNVPKESVSLYQVANVWKEFMNIEVNITPNEDPDHAGVYYSTSFDSANKYELPAGVEAYVDEVIDNAMYLHKIAEGGDIIPSNTAVILKSTLDSYILAVSDGSPVSVTETNHLHGVNTATAAPANCYVLSGHSSDNNVQGVGFYEFSGTLTAYKAYITLSGGAAYAPKRLRFVFDSPTGVDNVDANIKAEKRIENGQVIIIRNDVRYNAAGQIVK